MKWRLPDFAFFPVFPDEPTTSPPDSSVVPFMNDSLGTSNELPHRRRRFPRRIKPAVAMMRREGSGTADAERMSAGRFPAVPRFREFTTMLTSAPPAASRKQALEPFCRSVVNPVLAVRLAGCDKIIKFFQPKQPPVSAKDTLAGYAFMKAVEESKHRGGKSIPPPLAKCPPELAPPRCMAHR